MPVYACGIRIGHWSPWAWSHMLLTAAPLSHLSSPMNPSSPDAETMFRMWSWGVGLARWLRALVAPAENMEFRFSALTWQLCCLLLQSPRAMVSSSGLCGHHPCTPCTDIYPYTLKKDQIFNLFLCTFYVFQCMCPFLYINIHFTMWLLSWHASIFPIFIWEIISFIIKSDWGCVCVCS